MASKGRKKGFDFTLKDGRVVRIRPFGPKESPRELRRFINALVRSKAQILADRPVTLAEEERYVKRAYESARQGGAVHWLAVTSGGRIAGNVDATRGRHRDRDVVSLAVGVHPAFQGQGLGERMLRTVIADAKAALKPRLIYLTMMGTNARAQRLYRKVGFREVSRRPKWRKIGGKLADEVTMVYHPRT